MNYARVNWTYLMTLRPVDRVAAMVTMQPKMEKNKAEDLRVVRALIASPCFSNADFAGLKFGTVIVVGWIPKENRGMRQKNPKKSSGQHRACWLCYCTKCGVDFKQKSSALKMLAEMDGCHECNSEKLEYLATLVKQA